MPHEIFLSFDCNPPLEIHRVFLYISKVFHRVWFDGLSLKLKQNAVSGKLFQLIASFLTGRFQSVILNGQTLDWQTIRPDVSQLSSLGPLYFLTYVNNQTSNLKSNIKLLADDSKYIVQWLVGTKVCKWDKQWEMVFNSDLIKQAQKLIFLKNHIYLSVLIYTSIIL